ncbi:MAG: BlaB/IND/MUS family subclass B1 metallo-beta-lactamase [Ferruginibacter sp.]
MKHVRSAITAVFFLFTFTNSFSQSQQKLTISHLTGDFYVFTTYNFYKGEPVPSNGMYLVTDQGVVMFDSPWDTTQFQPLIDSIKSRHHKDVVICIATHSHADKTAGLQFLRERGVQTFTTRQTDDISKVTGKKRAEFLMDKNSLFSVGQYKFQTYYAGPGHTSDNIVVWFDKDKVLYGGCLVKSTESTDLGNLEDANVKQWPQTIKNIQENCKDPRYVIVGHGSWSSTKSLKHTLKLLKEYEKENKK